METKDDIVKNNPYEKPSKHEDCPKCGSTQTTKVSGWIMATFLFLGGLAFAGTGIWLIVIIIGIPMVIGGVGCMLIAPFMPMFIKTRMSCENCNHAWPTPKQREKMEKKKAS